MGSTPAVLMLITLFAIATVANFGRADVQEISFQHFKTQLLSKGLVDRLEVCNKSTVKVFVRPGQQRCLLCSPITLG